MRAKYDCYTKKVTNKHVCRHWMDPLKYYVWSFHDTTLSSLFSTLGFKRSNYNEDGYPQYSSCATFELWVRDDNSTYIKAYYLPLTNTSDHLIEEVTTEISGCENGCTLDQFEQRSQPFKPNGDGDTAALCNTNLFNDTSSSTLPTKAASSPTSPTEAASSPTSPTKAALSQTSPSKATSSLSSNQFLISIGLLVYVFKNL
uniref:Uncharacterized protein n=1 Tax=Acrobeloides nanus TaxID=290746 RepID=A0A914D4U0_9BILA